MGIGDLVVAYLDFEEGSYAAIVVHVDGDMLTLRWRDYPRERRIVRHRFRLGLLYPNVNPTVERGKASKGVGPGKERRQAGRGPSGRQRPIPSKIWDEIDINHLVLAKDDSQWGAWWEAIPVEKVGDSFKSSLARQPN